MLRVKVSSPMRYYSLLSHPLADSQCPFDVLQSCRQRDIPCSKTQQLSISKDQQGRETAEGPVPDAKIRSLGAGGVVLETKK
jgi:hypothetical protein